MATVRATITIDKELHKQIVKDAEKQQRSFSKQISYIAIKDRETKKE